jgi:Mrp family chromosome partitioning ATPase
MNKMNSDLHADEALTGMSDQDHSKDEPRKKSTGTALVAVPAGSLTGVERDPREEVWGVLHNAKRTEAEVPRTWRRRKIAARREAAIQAFDQLRTQFLQGVRSEGLKRIAVASPRSGNGSTFAAVNLARSLSRVPGCKTVLLDLNLRDPGVAETIGVEAEGNMDEFLTGEISFFQHVVRYNDGLALGLSRSARPNASDLLQSGLVAGAVSEMTHLLKPDVVMLDLPPILEFDDLSAVLPHVDGVLLIADGTSTQTKDIAECERLIKNRSKLMGVVLNRGRA